MTRDARLYAFDLWGRSSGRWQRVCGLQTEAAGNRFLARTRNPDDWAVLPAGQRPAGCVASEPYPSPDAEVAGNGGR